MADVRTAPNHATAGRICGACRRLRGPASGLAASIGCLVLASPTAMASPAARALSAGPIAHAQPTLERVAVFGRDDRRPLIGARPELRARMGVLRHRGTGAVCSAFCVATDVIATAGHCVPGATTDPAATVAMLRFKRDVDPLAASTGVAPLRSNEPAASVLTGASGLNTRPPINATSDWALLRLERHACVAGGLKLSSMSKVEITARANEGRVFHVAYHRDFSNWRLAIARHCRVLGRAQGRTGARGTDTPRGADMSGRDFENPGNLLLHTCDTGAASSGSPLLTDGAEGPEVVGINVGTYVRSRVITNDGEIVQRLSSETIANTALVVWPLVSKLQAFAGSEEKTGARSLTGADGARPVSTSVARSTPADAATPATGYPSVLVPSGMRDGRTGDP